MNEPHKIVRQTLDIQVFEDKDVYNLQTKVRDVYYEQLLPILNAQFDQIAPEGTTIKIDRLEIDLGEISVHSLDYSLKQELENIVAEYVYPIKEEIKAGHKKGSTVVGSNQEKIEWTLEKGKMSVLEALKVFLKTGVLPWGASKTIQEENNGLAGISALIQFCLEKYPDQLTRFLKENYRARTIQQRVFHHFSTIQIRELISMDHATRLKMQERELQLLVNEALSVADTTLSEASSKMKSIWWQIFIALQEMPTTDSSLTLFPSISWALKNEGIHTFSVAFILKKWSESPTELPVLKKLWETSGVPVTSLVKNQKWLDFTETQIKNKNPEIETAFQALQKRQNILLTRGALVSELKEFNTFWEQFVKISQEENKLTTEQIQRMKQQQEMLENTAERVAESSDIQEDSGENELQKSLEEGIAVNNAGLIILATYLPFLFDHLGWVDEERKLLPDAQEKALALTHFLVYDNEEIDESQLTLNKILLGIDLDEPIVNDYELNEEEKAEGMNLLEVVVQRWEALGKGTTPGGLQVSFLQRSGLLYLEEDQYLLRVERKTLDILLDRIPWTIATVKLNWMDKILLTEW